MIREKAFFLKLLKKYPYALKHKRMDKKKNYAWKKVTEEYSDIMMYNYKTDNLKRQLRELKALLKKKIKNLKYMLTENIEDTLFNWEKDLILLNHNEVLAKDDDEKKDKFDPSLINEFINSVRNTKWDTRYILMRAALNKSFDDEFIDDVIQIEDEEREQEELLLSSDTNSGYVENNNIIMFPHTGNTNNNTNTTSETTTTVVASDNDFPIISTDKTVTVATTLTNTVTKGCNEIEHEKEFIKIVDSKSNGGKSYTGKNRILLKEKDKPSKKRRGIIKKLLLDETEKMKTDSVINNDLSDCEKDNIIREKKFITESGKVLVIKATAVASVVTVNNVEDKSEGDLILEKSMHEEQEEKNNNSYENDEIGVKVKDINNYIINCELPNNCDHNYNKTNVDISRKLEIEKLNVSKNTDNVTTTEFIHKRPFRQCRKRKIFTNAFIKESNNIINENYCNSRLNKRKKRFNKSSASSSSSPSSSVINNNNNVEKLNSVNNSKEIEKGLIDNNKYYDDAGVESTVEKDNEEKLNCVDDDDGGGVCVESTVEKNNVKQLHCVDDGDVGVESTIEKDGVDKFNNVKSLKKIKKNYAKSLRKIKKNLIIGENNKCENNKYERTDSVESVVEKDETCNNNNNNGTYGDELKIPNVLVQLDNLPIEELYKCLLIQQIHLNDLFIKYHKSITTTKNTT